MTRFLRLFEPYRLMEKAVADQRATIFQMEQRADAAQARMDSELAMWRERCESLEARVTDLTDKMVNAGDSMALRVIGRRMFGKNPIEAPPVESIDRTHNISAGTGKALGRDMVKSKTADFFADLARESGVMPKN